MYKFKNSQKGTALVEALLAFTFAIVIITGIVTAVITAVRTSSFTKNQNLATQYAQEGLDIAKNFKDSDYAAFLNLATKKNHCANVSTSRIDSGVCASEIDGIFTRTIYVNHTGLDDGCETSAQNPSTYVSSAVSWSDSRCASVNAKCHIIKLDSCFNDLNKISNP